MSPFNVHKAKVARRVVIPSQGHFPLQCGNCGGTEFRVHVRPLIVEGHTTATVREVVCMKCAFVGKFDEEGFLVKGGIARKRPKGEGENVHVH